MTEKFYNLEETKEELKLESSGSGSGLLDLGKIADETSFGEDLLSGILEEEAKTPSPITGIKEKELEVAEERLPVTALVIPTKIPVETHLISNWVIMPSAFLVVIFGLVITIAGSRGFVPGLLTLAKDIIWWLLLGVIGLVLISLTFPHMKVTAKAKKRKFLYS